MSLFFESIRVVNGRVMNLERHQLRVNRTFQAYKTKPVLLKEIINTTDKPVDGIYKLRISYSTNSSDINISYNAYEEKNISTLQLVICDGLQYSYKAEDRAVLDRAFAQKGIADDVIFVIDNQLTDSWYCNIALWNGVRWETPVDCLLEGTMRAKLLKRKTIYKAHIAPTDLHKYSKIRLFNAMIPWSIEKDVSIKKVFLPLKEK